MPDHPRNANASSLATHQRHVNPWLLGGAWGMVGVALAPYVLPLLGVGGASDAEDIMHFIGGHGEDAGFGAGLAGGLQRIISNIPFVGGALTSSELVTIPGLSISVASGALVSIAAAAVIGYGGVKLAQWLEKREGNGPNVFHWSKVIRRVALSTSIFISLPSILSGVSVGITFLASLVNATWSNNTIIAMKETLGATSMNMGATGGLASILPHLITCGGAIIPITLALLSGKKLQPEAHEASADHGSETHPMPNHTAMGHSAAPAPLVEKTKPVIQLVTSSPPTRGQPCQLAFRVSDPVSGKTLTADDIAIAHTKKLHTMVVDQSLTEYHHIHPDFDAASGLWKCEFTPKLPNKFFAWHDFTPVGADKPVYQRTDIPSPNAYDIPARLIPSSSASAGGLTLSLSADPPLASGRDSMLRMVIRDANGQPVNNLEPVMGAYGHLAGFSADGQHFIHSHPLAELGTPIKNGTLDFHIAPGQAGMTKFFLQLRYQGREVILPFAQAIAREPTHAEQVSAPMHHHAARLAA